MSTDLPLHFGRAATFQLDVKRDGVALSLDGQTLILTVCRLQNRPAAEASIRCVSGEKITHVPSVVGRAIARIPVSDTLELNPLVNYYWDAALIDDAGNLIPVEGLAGRVLPASVVSAAA